DSQAVQTGVWTRSRSTGNYVGDGYLHDGNEDKGKKRVRFTPKLPAGGRYEGFLYYTPHANRATNGPVAGRSVGGRKTVTVNQPRPLEKVQPLRLGAFEFAAGEAGWVEVRTEGTDGHVIADAVQFVPVN